MPDNNEQLAGFLQFIKERRSDESHFGEIYNKLKEVMATMQRNGNKNADFVDRLNEIKDKQAAEYKQAKENSGTAWPEFEKFITQLEKTTVDTLKE